MRTVGISPKVYLPGIGQIILGIALILADLPVEGKTMIGTGLATFGIGAAASPGTVVPKTPDPDPLPTAAAASVVVPPSAEPRRKRRP